MLVHAAGATNKRSGNADNGRRFAYASPETVDAPLTAACVTAADVVSSLLMLRERSSTGLVRRYAFANAAADTQAYFVQASFRFKPMMSLMPRIVSMGVLLRVARWTPADSISIAWMFRAAAIQGKS